jgi:hypothetical protein
MSHGRVLAMGLLLCALVCGCEYAKGRAAVAQMCARDGGLSITETVNVRGYLDLRGRSECSSCMEAVGKQRFDYVDAQLGENRRYDLYPEPGYYRHSRARVGDPRCEAYVRGRPNKLIESQKRWGLAPDECIAIELLGFPPQGFVYDQRFHTITTDSGVPLGVVERVIADGRTDKTLAVYRDYVFSSESSLKGDMGGRGGKVDAHCEDPDEPSVRGLRFVSRILKDPAKPLQ